VILGKRKTIFLDKVLNKTIIFKHNHKAWALFFSFIFSGPSAAKATHHQMVLKKLGSLK
jgi:hypothetical protein